VSDGELSARQYDAMAVEYALESGLKVLEVGCGAGSLTAWLLDQGASVTAFDVSPEMVGLARRRVGDGAVLLVADVG